MMFDQDMYRTEYHYEFCRETTYIIVTLFLSLSLLLTHTHTLDSGPLPPLNGTEFTYLLLCRFWVWITPIEVSEYEKEGLCLYLRLRRNGGSFL